MAARSPIRLALLGAAIALPWVAGCDIDTHKTATGVQTQAPETKSPTDPGKLNAGGPGAPSETPK